MSEATENVAMDAQLLGQLRALNDQLETQLKGLKSEQAESKRLFNEMRFKLAALQVARQERRVKILALEDQIKSTKRLLGVKEGNSDG